MRIHLIAYRLRRSKGLTLIELLVAMAVSGILIAGVYRTFIGQHKTYAAQEQIVDMRQNARVAISRMMREIRMAGFGNVSDVLSLSGGVNSFTQVITPGSNGFGNAITIVGGFRQIKDPTTGDPITVTSAAGNTITLSKATDEFDGNAHKYISVGGIGSYIVQSRSGSNLTLDRTPIHPVGANIFKISAITYDLYLSDGKIVLGRNENTGGYSQPVAEHIETLGFRYTLDDGSESDFPVNPSRIRMVKVTVTARTSVSDPEFKGGTEGYRRRTITSNILVRNMGANP